MTWWGAVGLALSLYGMVVLLEWVYGRLLHGAGDPTPPISVVLSAVNQEAHIEQAIRELQGLWQQGASPRLEFLIVDQESDDQTALILERLSRLYPAIRILPASWGREAIMRECRYPIIVWVDLAAGNVPSVLGTVKRMLFNTLLSQSTGP